MNVLHMKTPFLKAEGGKTALEHFGSRECSSRAWELL